MCACGHVCMWARGHAGTDVQVPCADANTRHHMTVPGWAHNGRDQMDSTEVQAVVGVQINTPTHNNAHRQTREVWASIM
jgi:hypothetical protein